MRLELYQNPQHLFVLGAGASVDYGLPVWRDLSPLIREKIEADDASGYQYKQEILAWLDKVDVESGYATLDECIQKESIAREYHENGEEIENEIFRIIKAIFKEKYHSNEGGWVRKLNDHVLNSDSQPETHFAFVNFNYDLVLENNLLNFGYLPSKWRRYNSKHRLGQLSSAKIPVLYPHGNLFKPQEIRLDTHVSRYLETMKSGDPTHLDAVSCFESLSHNIHHITGRKVRLYILGLGAGLQINLNNIYITKGVGDIHVTVRDMALKDGVVKFLSEKYGISPSEIHTYSSCDELITSCFPS